jgi:hypothetical protein
MGRNIEGRGYLREGSAFQGGDVLEARRARCC